MIDTNAASRIRRVRQEPRRRSLRVVAVEPVGRTLLSVTVEGDELADFQSPSFDDHVKLTFEGESGEVLKRDMTPRRYDPDLRRLTIEIAQHDGGQATIWARKAVPGQPVTISGPKGSVVVPVDFPWHVLCGDLTALPAIGRRLEELPEDVEAIVVVMAPDPADHRQLATSASLKTHWVTDEAALLEALAAHTPDDGRGFVWCAAEAGLATRLREFFLQGGRHPREMMRISGYWKRNETGFHTTLERSGIEQGSA